MNNAGIALYRLLPTGEAWPDENEDTNLRKFMFGISHTVDDLLSTLQEVMAQYYPGQPGIFLADWEEVLQLPKCGQTEQSLQERLAQVLAMFRISEYSNAEFFESIAAVFGFTISVSPAWPAEVSITADSIPASPPLTYYEIVDDRPAYRVAGSYPYLASGASGTVWVIGRSDGETWTKADSSLIPPTDWTGVTSSPSGFPAPIVVPAGVADPFRITIHVDDVDDIDARAGWSSVGDPLFGTQTSAILECVLNFFKLAHTHMVFV